MLCICQVTINYQHYTNKVRCMTEGKDWDNRKDYNEHKTNGENGPKFKE